MARKGSDAARGEEKRGYLSQGDVPGWPLTQALKVPQAIADNYGKNPTKPLRVAEAMGLSPSSSYFRALCGAAIAYGLTEGGYNAELIQITPLARRIVAPTQEGDDTAALREAFLRPRIVRDFLTRYNESRLPADPIARNVLEELGVPAGRTKDAFSIIVEGARELGFLRELKGQTYVDLDNAQTIMREVTAEPAAAADKTPEYAEVPISEIRPAAAPVPAPAQSHQTDRKRTGRVFITHGRNKEIVAQLKDLLTFGGFTPIVALEQETASKPVPDKVLDDMRSCDAAIIHVGTDLKLLDADGKERKMLNQNVLIEIGAAMALYGGKFILLVEAGTTLPSNLQGLYEVRYTGEKLDYESTMKLLKAFNDFRG